MTTKPATKDETEELALTPGTVAYPGYTVCTIININTSKQMRGYLSWGTAAGVYTHYLPAQLAVPVYNPDGSVGGYSLTFTIGKQYNLQQAANQIYYYAIFFSDATKTAEQQWTQPGLNASGSDGVILDNRNLTRMAAMAFIASRAAAQGWHYCLASGLTFRTVYLACKSITILNGMTDDNALPPEFSAL